MWGPTYRFEARTWPGNVTFAITGRATGHLKKEVTKTVALPVHAVRMSDEDFRNTVSTEFAKAVAWCREAAGVF